MRKIKRLNVNKEGCYTDILMMQKRKQVFAIQTFVQ